MNQTPRHTSPDRQTTRIHAARTRPKDSRTVVSARRATAILLCLALLVPLFAAGGARTQAARQQAEIEIEGTPSQPTAAATVNLAHLAAQDSAQGKDAFAALGAAAAHVEPPPAPPEPESESKLAAALPATKSQPRASKSGAGSVVKSAETSGASASGEQPDPVTASAVGDESRAPAVNFTAQTDAGTHAPPDTSGAVGLDKVLSTTRASYVIQDKATGAVLSTVSAESFWASTGASGVYNSRALYDPYNNRWLLSAASNARSAASSVLLAVSQSYDPQGSFYLFRFDADPDDLLWADYVSAGFNGNWVALTFNAHNLSNDLFNQGFVIALSAGHLGVGVAVAERFPVTAGQGGSSMQPVVTYSKWQEARQFFVSHLGSGAATYRVSWLEQTPGGLSLFIGAQKVNGLGGWTQPGGETLPQAGGSRKIESSDSRVQKAVYRNGSIYYCQTVGLPAGRTAATVDRTAAQWTQVDTNGDFVQGGRIEDPTATPTNGGKWYAYPSIAVNHLGDVLVGFSEFSATQYASAGYAVHVFDDPAGTARTPHIYKAGEGHYERALAGARNLWGLYSNAQVDPSNDVHLWTIQEYAAPPAGTGPGSGRWATRWAKLIPPSADRVAFVSNRDGNDEIYVVEADGSHLRRLTNNPAQDTSPTWSPDRGRIAFTRYGPSGAEIHTINADGTNDTFLTYGSDPAWSPSNAHIAFVRDIDIWTYLVDDGEELNATNNWDQNGYYGGYISYYYCADSAPSWAPDGETLVFGGQIEDSRYIFTMPYWGGERTLIKSGDGINEPSWSPDGTKIAYGNYGRICTMNPDGTGSVCTTAFNRDFAPAWSPDSLKLTFFTNRTGNLEVFTMNPDFGGAANLTNSPASADHTPGW